MTLTFVTFYLRMVWNLRARYKLKSLKDGGWGGGGGMNELPSITF